MNVRKTIHIVLTLMIAMVWVVNGLYCKILGLVPRHEQIVARILGSEYSAVLTIAIGVAELFMAVWVLSGLISRSSALTQIAVVAVMNVIEFIFVPDLLLFGRMNAIIACAFIALVYCNEFIIKPTTD